MSDLVPQFQTGSCQMHVALVNVCAAGRTWTQKGLGLNPSSAVYWLPDIGQVTKPVWSLAFLMHERILAQNTCVLSAH